MKEILIDKLSDWSEDQINNLVLDLEKANTLKAANALNQLLEKDPRVIQSLLSLNVACSVYAGDTPFYVTATQSGYWINVLGLLQGVLSDKHFLHVVPHEVVGLTDVTSAKFFTIIESDGSVNQVPET